MSQYRGQNLLKAIEAAQVSAQVRPPKVRIVIESTNDPLMEGVLDQFLHQGDGLQIPNEGPSDNIGSNADDMPDDIVDLDDGLWLPSSPPAPSSQPRLQPASSQALASQAPSPELSQIPDPFQNSHSPPSSPSLAPFLPVPTPQLSTLSKELVSMYSDSLFEDSLDESEDDSDEYAMYPLDEDVPVEYSSDVSDDESQSIFVDSPDEADETESTNLELSFRDNASSSEISTLSDDELIDDVIPLVQPPPKTSSETLEPINLAFASWSWTHGISFDAYHNLQQLLHSDMIDQPLPLLRSLKGVREHVTRFLRLCPLQSIRIYLKVSKLSIRTKNRTRINKSSSALIATKTMSTLFYHQIRDLLYRVLSNPQLKSRIYNQQYTTIHQPSSAPWHGFAWRLSYTLSKGPSPPQINGLTVYPGRFVLFSHNALLRDGNVQKVQSFDIRSLSKNASSLRLARICSVVSQEGVRGQAALGCEIDPILTYSELPNHLQTPSRAALTADGAVQCFLADFEWSKPVISFEEVDSVFDDIRMVDMHVQQDNEEKTYVVTEILTCKRTFLEERLRSRDTLELKCSFTDHNLRHASWRQWLFGELEMLKYGESHFAPFTLPAGVGVVRLGIAIYDDDFNAYRGVYHGIGGVYLGVLNLSFDEQESLRNIHPIMFIPHAAERHEIYQELERDLVQLERKGMLVEVRGKQYMIFVKLLLQITDMPQGNLLAKVRKPTAFLPCRCCLVTEGELGDVNFDFLNLGRYQRRMNQIYQQYETLLEEEEARAAEKLLTDYSLLPLQFNRLPFQGLAFDPYTHIPHDPSHSELAGLSAKALELTLVRPIQLYSAGHLRYLDFPACWSRLQHPVSHNRSYSFSDYAKMAILAPFILFRVFGHLRPEKSLKRSILLEQRRSAEFLRQRVLALWVSVARVNHLLFSDFVDIPCDLQRLQLLLAEERELFLEVGKLAPGFEKATPNYHIALHLPHQIYLYGSAATFSTSLYEMLHRHVKNTNHHILDRAFLQYINVLQTTRLHLEGGFGRLDAIYVASITIRQVAPLFFSSTILGIHNISNSEDAVVAEPEASDKCLIEIHTEWTDIRLGTQLKQREIRKLSPDYHVEIHRLPSNSSLLQGLRAAYDRGYLTAPRTPLLAGPLAFYSSLSYLNSRLLRRITVRTVMFTIVGPIDDEEIGMVHTIFTHQQYGRRRLFVVLRWARHAGFQQSLHAPIFTLPPFRPLVADISPRGRPSVYALHDCEFRHPPFLVRKAVQTQIQDEEVFVDETNSEEDEQWLKFGTGTLFDATGSLRKSTLE